MSHSRSSTGGAARRESDRAPRAAAAMHAAPAAPALARIAVGVDLAAPSREALEWVVRELSPDAELMLVHALSVAPPGFLDPPRPAPSPAVTGEAREFVSAKLRDIAARLGRPDARIEVQAGDPAGVVAGCAEDWGADLIVVGPHGGERVPERGIGTTAERLGRTSPIPLLLVQGMRAGPPRRVLVPLDDVDLTPAVLDWAGLIATRTGATLVLAHVLDRRWLDARLPSSAGAAGAEDVAGLALARASAAAGDWLREAARHLPDDLAVEHVVATGAPGEEVLALMRRADADGVVMGRRGRGRVLPGVLGSTVSTVLRRADRPVLIVVDPADRIVDDWGTESMDASMEA